jgi:hypothetical protein
MYLIDSAQWVRLWVLETTNSIVSVTYIWTQRISARAEFFPPVDLRYKDSWRHQVTRKLSIWGLKTRIFIHTVIIIFVVYFLQEIGGDDGLRSLVKLKCSLEIKHVPCTYSYDASLGGAESLV